MSEESALCVPRSEFDALGSFQGVSLNVDRYLPLLTNPKITFIPRSLCEIDPYHKQIIPYFLILRSGKLLRYWRTKVSGEERLASKASIGIGGHLNLEDFPDAGTGPHTGMNTVKHAMEHDNLGELYRSGSLRELQEELVIVSPWGTKNSIVGFINDDSDEVGQVHLGVIHLVEIDDMGGLTSDDRAIKLGGFHHPIDLRRGVSKDSDVAPFEAWSKIILESDLSTLLNGQHGRPYPFFEHA